MELLPTEMIRKKRFGGTHTREELRAFIQAYAREVIPDYQMSAWLMAVCLKGMTAEETAWLTMEMRDSGVVLDLSHLGVTVDKHSTGGIGDKTSLILAPLVAAAGVVVPMMAGRGLAHTGGTLDKLESIPGFNVRLSFDQFKAQLASVGGAIIGQTAEICPADRKLYSLRDVTGTVDSMPLICGSIMSKKLAEGMSALVLDVKFGSGAFMKTVEDAEALARALMSIAQLSGKKAIALLTRMDEPLGRFVGNALETRECLDILDGKSAPTDGKDFGDTLELSLELAAHMIVLGGKAPSHEVAKNLARELLANGSARRKFNEICSAQGGDLRQPLKVAAHTQDVVARHDGFMNYVDLEKMGLAAVHLGAGRRTQTDELDLGAGIEMFKNQADAVKKGDILFRLYHSDEQRAQTAEAVLQQCFGLTPVMPTRSPLIAKVLT